MDTISRLIRNAIARGFGWRIGSAIAVGLLSLLGFARESHAYGTVSPQTGQVPGYGASWSGFELENPKSSGPAAAQALMEQVNALYNEGCHITSYVGTNGFVGICASGIPAQGSWRVVGTVPAEGCPSNSTQSGSNCTCAEGYKPYNFNTECVAADSCTTIAAANTAMQATFEGGTFKSLTFCNGGCVMNATNGYGSPGNWSLTGRFEATGAHCTGTGNNGFDVTDKVAPLPAGRCPGQVNGVDVPGGVPCGTTVTKDETKTTKTDTPASGPSSIGPTTTETTTTTCEGGNCTKSTTSTTTNPDGSSSTSTKEQKEPKPQDSFCKENPNLQICKESSASNTCSGGAASVNCSGDAVQCAILKEAAARNCELFNKTNPQSDAGIAAVGAGDRPGDHPRKTGNAGTESIAFSSSISQATLIGSTCPADVSVSMGGSLPPVVIAFSKICEPAALLGNVGVGFASLVCLFIVFKRD